MNLVRKNFIYLNESFVCQECGAVNDEGKGFVRNHCSQCLCSLHLDLDVPGDRLNKCEGIMEPMKVEYRGGKGYVIAHKCSKCSFIRNNMSVPDDNFDKIIALTLMV